MKSTAPASMPSVETSRHRLSVTVMAAALMVSLAFLNPVHLPPLPTFYEESLALALGLVALACLALRRGPASINIPNISVWAAALSGFLILQPYWTAAPYAQSAQLAGLYVMWAAAIMCVGANLRAVAEVEKTAEFLATAMLLSALLGAGAGWVQVLGLTDAFGGIVPPLVGGRAAGFLAQPNLHANHLVVGAACLAYLYAARRISAAVAVLAGMLLANGIGFSASRAAVLELGWLLLFSVCYGLRRSGSSPSLRFPIAVFAVIFVAVLSGLAAPLGAGLGSGIVDRSYEFVRTGGELHGASAVRLAIYEAAIRAWLNAPLFGVGIGGFAWAHYTIPTTWVGIVAMNPEIYAHDIVLQFLAETGLAGTALLVIGVSMWFLRTLRALSGKGSLPQAWAVGIVGIEFVHSIVEFPLWHAHFLGLAALLMGFAECRSFTLRSKAIGRVLALGIVLVGGALLALTSSHYQQLRYWGYAIPQELRSDRRVRLQERKIVEKLRHSLLLPYVDIGLALSLPLSKENLPDKISFNERVMHFWPVYPIVQNQIAFLALAGREAQSLALLEHLARLQPDTLAELRAMLERLPVSELPEASAVRAKVAALARRAGP